MRSKKALLNIAMSMLQQIIVVVCGLITPRLIITSFGSGYNGITTSVTQFLSIIALLRAGVGGVTRASLYKPLAEKNTLKISAIVRATEIFMRKIAMIFLLYVVGLACVYPFVLDQSAYGGWLSISSYIIILSIGTVAQYYFAITYQLLLTADQQEYICSALQIVQTILNTVLAVVLINAGASIHIVKLASAIAFMITPIFLHFYVKRKYHIVRKVEPDKTALGQRWDAFAHNVADFIHGNTDLMVLTLLAGNIMTVSVYSVYYLVINGIKRIVTICTTGLEAAFGNMIAKEEYETAHRTLGMYEFAIYTITTILFTCVTVLIIPFVRLYTAGVTDVDYYQPVFAMIATVAEAVYCVRIPYSAIVYACGHYRQTRNGAMVEAAINLCVSILLVLLFRIMGMGPHAAIIGVAIGTLTANSFRTVQFILYLSRKLLKRSVKGAVYHLLFMFAIMGGITSVTFLLGFGDTISNAVQWAIYAGCAFMGITLVTLAASYLVYRKDLEYFIKYIHQIIKPKG